MAGCRQAHWRQCQSNAASPSLAWRRTRITVALAKTWPAGRGWNGRLRIPPLGHIIFSLEPAPPFQLELTVWALRRRPDNKVDRWDGECYRRALPLTDQFVEVAVKQMGPGAVSSIAGRRALDGGVCASPRVGTASRFPR